MKIPLDLAEILRIRKLDWKMFICLFVCLFVCLFIYSFVFCFNHHRISKGSFTQNFVKIGHDLAEILRISKLDWHDGRRKKEKGRRGILLCNGLMYKQYILCTYNVLEVLGICHSQNQ